MEHIDNGTQSNKLIKLIKLFISVITLLVIIVSFFGWDSFVSSTVEFQKDLHAMLANHIQAVSEDAFKYGGALIALSFGYGVFHAVGPGHGKAVIVTYLGTNKESAKKGIFISFAAALLQSVIAVLLVSTLAQLLKFRLTDAHNYGNDIAMVSYILVMLLGLMLVVSSIRRVAKYRSHKVTLELDNHHSHSHLENGGSGYELSSHAASELEHSHANSSHDSDCGCSHTHVPVKDVSAWQTLGIIFSMGLRPCSGAIVVLIYAHLVGVYVYGVTATLMMGIGTGLSISLIALGTLYARSLIERFLSTPNARSAEHNLTVMGQVVRGLGGLVLIALGWSLYSAASLLSAGHPLF